MREPAVWVFFYGSYMNLGVLRELGLVPERVEAARLDGFELVIAPRANLVRAPGCSVYGVAATATHRERARLYAHAREVLGEVYLPEAVVVETRTAERRPALCYIAPQMEPRAATDDYVDRILEPARELRFPEWYVAR